MTMKKKNEDSITYQLTSSHLTCISPEEILEKFGAMIFCTDEEYNLWCRENIGGSEKIHFVDSK